MSGTDIITLIKEFEGIIGALLGVVVTMVLTRVFQNAGKVTSYVEKVEFSFYKRDEVGGMEKIEEVEDSIYGTVTFSILMHNSSETLKALRNFKIVFSDENNSPLFSNVPRDEATIKFVASQHIRDELSIVNIPPKHIVRYDIFASLSEHDCRGLRDCKYVFIEFYETNSRRKNLVHTF